MLELDVIADRQIGSDEEGGLSLEQRKRTTLGVELAANPSLIFLDEPTSGLDARSAQVRVEEWGHERLWCGTCIGFKREMSRALYN